MPYRRKADLPERVRKNLPPHAESIYMKTFNSAAEQYGSEERAHRVAWAAVKRKYQKGSEGTWHAKVF